MIEGLQLVSDIELYKNEKNQYMVSSEKMGVYLVLNEKLYNFLMELLVLIKNNDSTVDFVDNNTRNGIDFLKKYYLLCPIEQESERKTTVEAEILGNQLWHKDILIEKKSKILVVLLIMIGVLNTVVLIFNIILLLSSNAISDFISGYENFDFFNIRNIIIANLLIFGSLFFHEFGHVCFANYHNVYIKSISIYLHFGVAPMAFVKYRNIYKKSKGQRIIILAGGMIFNFILFNFSLLFTVFSDSWIFVALLIINLVMIINNITSFYNSDTYFLLCEAFNFGSLKYRVLKTLNQLFCKEIRLTDCVKQPGFKKVTIYFLVSYLFKIILLFRVAAFVLDALGRYSAIRYIVLLGLILYYMLNITKYYKRIKTKVY